MYIDTYSFGKITIDGKIYTNDVIIYPDRIEDSWWRKEGHRLVVEDIRDIVKAEPEVVVLGTGDAGIMKVTAQVKDQMDKFGIQLIAQPTSQACKTYNELSKTRKVIAALHLTC